MKKFLKFIFLDLALLFSAIEIFIENEWADRADDIAFVGLTLIAILLPKFLKKRLPNFFSSLFLILAVSVKVIALFVEHDDVKAVEFDYVIIILMILGIIIFGKNKKK